MTAKEFLKTQANPDDVIAITCDADWELTHLENLLEEYHQAKLKELVKADVVGQREQFKCSCTKTEKYYDHVGDVERCQKCEKAL